MKLTGKIVYVFEKECEIEGVTYQKHYAEIDDIKVMVYAPCHLNVGDECEYKLSNYIPRYNPDSKERRKNNLRISFVKILKQGN